MRIIGSDFTSDPRPGKPIVAAWCRVVRDTLVVETVERLVNFQSFALLLCSEGPWVAGLDFPFGQPQRLIDDLEWPPSWAEYVRAVAVSGKRSFRATLDSYRKRQPPGQKEHLRDADRRAGAISPMKLYGVPVGLMFCEGAPYLLASPASILPFLPDRDATRIVLETYPRLVVEKFVGRTRYKSDDRQKVTEEQADTRRRLIDCVRDRSRSSRVRRHYGISIQCEQHFVRECVEDVSGDTLDAVLCALQAAWAWTRRSESYGIPTHVNTLEGWISDPAMFDG